MLWKAALGCVGQELVKCFRGLAPSFRDSGGQVLEQRGSPEETESAKHFTGGHGASAD